ncbi:MAG: Do family serine endopeptidase AlgW [Congregibacter sp.]
MRAFFQYITWPAIAGVLVALLILQQWVVPDVKGMQLATGVLNYRQAVAKATPSVVNIYTAKRVTEQNRRLLNNRFMPIPRGAARQRVERSLGSGVIMRDDGYILTNYHVIAEADAIQVLLSDGRRVPAEPVGFDVDTDLAALRVDLDNLSAVEVANSDQISVGDIVLAIGNPLGCEHSVTQGIISGLGRFGMNPGAYEGFIQTDAVIHPGSSGGALVDAEGQLVGINTLIYTSADGGNNGMVGIGISLAIPSNLARFIMDDLIRYGRVIRGWLGVEAEPIAGVGTGDGQRLFVRSVVTDGPADRAGIREGDIITHFDDEAITDVRLSMYELSLLRPGDKLTITVLRDTGSEDLTAIVGQKIENENAGN